MPARIRQLVGLELLLCGEGDRDERLLRWLQIGNAPLPEPLEAGVQSLKQATTPFPVAPTSVRADEVVGCRKDFEALPQLGFQGCCQLVGVERGVLRGDRFGLWGLAGGDRPEPALAILDQQSAIDRLDADTSLNGFLFNGGWRVSGGAGRDRRIVLDTDQWLVCRVKRGPPPKNQSKNSQADKIPPQAGKRVAG